MSSQKAEFELRMVEKAKELQNLIKEILKCLQSINSLFKFTPGKSTKLTKHGHSIFSKLGLLKNDGGKCSKCGKYRRLISKSRGDGLVWKCTSCKKHRKALGIHQYFPRENYNYMT